jgi:DNA-binding MarR family transcriptional regulator
MARAEAGEQHTGTPETRALTDEDFGRLLEFRTGIRRFLHWSEAQAEAVGLTGAQHQLLLAVRGRRRPEAPTIGDVADALLLRHHSAVGLVDRAAHAGLVVRRPDDEDARIVRLELTARGRRKLDALSEAHLEELRRLGSRIRALWDQLDTDG